MNKKLEIRKNFRPKSEGVIKHISEPFDVKHDLHIGNEMVEESSKANGLRKVSPPAPCPGQKEHLDQTLSLDQQIARAMREEILPVLRFEIGDIIEEKINKILDERNTRMESVHCSSCTCDEPTYPRRADQVLDDSPRPCTALILDNSDLLSDTSVEKLHVVPDIQSEKESQDQTKENSFSNPIYHHRGKSLLVNSQYEAKTMKNETEETSMRGKPLSRSDERECLANALQTHIKELVDGIVFPDNQLAEDLLADNCLTEEECASIRRVHDRKYKVRVLLCTIKGRDFDIMKTFLRHVRSHNEAVADSIEVKFEQNKKERKRCSKCAFCQLSSQVNLKYIVDDLWKSGLINDGLFSMIVQTDKPAGAQSECWNGVIDSLNKYISQSPADVSHILADALRKKQHYDYLAKGVDWMIYTNKRLACICRIRQKHVRDSQSSSRLSSISSASSVSDLRIQPHDGTVLSANTVECSNAQKIMTDTVRSKKECVDGDLSDAVTTVVERQKPGDNSHQTDKTLEDNNVGVSASNKDLQMVGYDVNPCTKSPRKPRGSNSIVTQLKSEEVVKTCETTSVKRPPKRIFKPKLDVNSTDNWEILHV